MKISRVVMFLSAILLPACSSAPIPINYYSLAFSGNSNETSNATLESLNISQKLKRVSISPVILPSFLSQAGIVTQLDNHQIKIANYNLWAEPLDKVIAKLLVRELNTKSKYYQFERMIGPWNADSSLNLRIEFEKFHISSDSRVVIGGRYGLFDKQKTLTFDKYFDIHKDLKRDGYLHAVEQLSQSVTDLSDEIITELEGLN
jgi:uncharacterized lipoprotein YmbA